MKTASLVTLGTIEVLEARIAPAVFTVINVADAGAGSLRQALADANSSPGTDTIVFNLPAPPLPEENIIKLASQLTSKGDVIIKGPGAGKLIIDGDDKSRVFNFNDGDIDRNSPVVIKRLSVVNGNAGTGINMGEYGGGIYSSESLTVKNVVISGNKAADGGGIFARPRAGFEQVSIINSVVSGNSASGANGGGGIYAVNLTSLTISSSVITGNTTANKSGGIYVGAHGTVTITDSVISGNRAGTGGGLGVTNYSSPSGGQTVISGTKISGNTSTDGGGGLYIKYGDTVITDSLIRNNTAVFNGGGLLAKAPELLTISKSLISGNQTTKTNADYQGGGGLFLKGLSVATLNPVKVVDTKISDNYSASLGGGILALNGVALTITRDTFSGNGAIGSGGGLQTTGDDLNKVDLTVKGSRFSDNVASLGGGICAAGDGVISITGAKVSENVAVDAGGIFARSSDSVTIKDVIATGNSALEVGGGVGKRGGGLFIDSTPKFLISGGSFSGNIANQGGGIYVAHSAGKILDAIITGNVAKTAGGGVFRLAGTGDVILEIAKVTANTAPTAPNVSGTFTFA